MTRPAGFSAATATATPEPIELAPQHDLFGRIMRGGERVGSFAVVDEAALGRAAWIAAKTAVFKRDQADTRADKLFESGSAQAERSAIAVEIDDDWRVLLCRDIPGGDVSAVRCPERHFFRLGQARLCRRGALGVWKVHQRALRQIKHKREADIEAHRDDCEPLADRKRIGECGGVAQKSRPARESRPAEFCALRRAHRHSAQGQT